MEKTQRERNLVEQGEEIKDQALRRQGETPDEDDGSVTNTTVRSRKRLKFEEDSDDDIKKTLKADMKHRQEMENKRIINESERLEMEKERMKEENERFIKCLK